MKQFFEKNDVIIQAFGLIVDIYKRDFEVEIFV